MEKFSIETRGYSSDEYNLKCISHTGLNFTNSEYEEVSVPGRDTPFIKNKYTKPRVSVQVEAIVDSDDLITDASLIKRWLTNDVRDERIYLTNMGDYYLKGFLDNKLDIEQVIRQTGQINFTFNCQPFLYHTSGDVEVVAIQDNEIKKDVLINPAHEGKPLIKISCSGEVVKFSIGGNQITLKNVDSTYYIDCQSMEMYMYDNSNNIVLQNSKMYSDFFILGEGRHTITVEEGTVSNLSITPRWRV